MNGVAEKKHYRRALARVLLRHPELEDYDPILEELEKFTPSDLEEMLAEEPGRAFLRLEGLSSYRAPINDDGGGAHSRFSGSGARSSG